MHDTAYEIGRLFFETYVGENARVLDFGSYDVNGSLRDFARPGWEYTGVDISSGPGVDRVIEPGAALPFNSGSFDCVVTTSVLEHDLFFWDTFVELVRVCKRGGYVYINAPSNGPIHRYPRDSWRFYPDAGRTLCAWATACRRPAHLVESFVALRKSDVWNDYVAVARVHLEPNSRHSYLHQQAPCMQVDRWDGFGTLQDLESSEDQERLRLALLRVQEPDCQPSQGGGAASMLGSAGRKLAIRERRSSLHTRLRR